MPDLNTKNRRAGPRRIISLWLVGLAVVPICLLNLLIHLLPNWWVSDMFIHFRVQYLAVGIIGCLSTLWLRKRWIAVLAASAIALNALPVYQFLVDSPNREPALNTGDASNASPPIPFRIASANIRSGNSSYAETVSWIRREAPDVVALIETRRNWLVAMRQLLPEYPHRRLVVKRFKSGKLILSKLPIEKLEMIRAGEHRSPTPIATITKNGVSIRFAALHTSWPMKKEWAADRNTELIELGEYASLSPLPLVAVGDFNVTPFSRHFAAMMERGNLRRAAAGRGWLPTWPVFFPPAGIQIDHILLTPGIAVTGYQTGAGLKSDHRWLLADLLIPATKQVVDQSPAKR